MGKETKEMETVKDRFNVIQITNGGLVDHGSRPGREQPDWSIHT
jgi:hypothetical protein